MQREQAQRALALDDGQHLEPALRLRETLGLPTFETSGQLLYKRLAFVAERGRIAKVFYPAFPPDRNAAEVVAWLTAGA